MRNIFKNFWRWFNYVATRRAHRETIKILNRLSDRELKDIGINRGDIDHMIWLKEDYKERGTDK